MKIGLFTILYDDQTLGQVLDRFAALGGQCVEIGVGGYSKSSHASVSELLTDEVARNAFLRRVRDTGLEISALSVHGNPVHPDSVFADRHHAEFLAGCELAGQLGVETVLALSGTPGGAPGDRTPNWITCPWPEDFLKASAYQWDEVLIPHWRQAASQAAERGVRNIGIEMHPGMCVYNPETLLKLREAVGNSICCNFDPSHLFWQGIDPVEAVQILRGTICHMHAKDCAVNKLHVRKNGVLSPRHYAEFSERPWTFRTIGFGHGETEWKQLFQALAMDGFDGAVSIEHEDAFFSRNEGFERAVRFLKDILPREKAGAMWWA